MTENNDSNVVNWLSPHSHIQIMSQLFQAKLVEIFSSMDISIIERALLDNNNDIHRTIDQLIAHAATIDGHQTVQNYKDKVYAGIMGNMHGGILNQHFHGN